MGSSPPHPALTLGITPWRHPAMLTLNTKGGTMTDDPVTPTEPSTSRKRRLTPWIFAGIGVVVVAAAIAIPLSISAAQQAAAEEEAARVAAEAQAAEEARLATFTKELNRCGITSINASVLDGGEAVEMTRVTKYDGPTYSELICLLQGLRAPSAIEAEIGQTRALDGRQTDGWDGYSISWGYHPDDGASIVIRHQ